MNCGLALAELETFSCFRTARLLALDGACIAREESENAELGAMRFVHLHECACDCETERTGLSGGSAAVDVRLHIKAAERVCCSKWLLNRGDERRTREVIAERADRK